MKTASAPLIALLNSGNEFYMADLLTFTLLNGTILRYAIYDTDLTYNSNLYTSAGVLFKRSNVRTVKGVEVDTLTINAYPKTTDLINGVTWLQSAARGVLDNSTVKLERVFMSSVSPTPVIVGGYVNFSGRLADLTMTRSEIEITVNSDLELLNIQMPRNLYQPGCQHTLYDADCGVIRGNFLVNSSAMSGSTKQLILCNLTNQNAYFDLGYIKFTSGQLNGTSATIKGYTQGKINLVYPLIVAPAAGDTFSINPGCDKQQATCRNKFNNLANFRGFTTIPVPETAR